MPETNAKILVCNSGSSSLKFSLFEAEEELFLAEGSVDWSRKPTKLVFHRTGKQELREELKVEKHADALARIFDDSQAGPSAALDGLEDLGAVGHRVVHGDERYTSAVRITDADIATRSSTARILVIATREDLTIIREARRLTDSSASLRTSKSNQRF